jgi:hypothetical protein
MTRGRAAEIVVPAEFPGFVRYQKYYLPLLGQRYELELWRRCLDDELASWDQPPSVFIPSPTAAALAAAVLSDLSSTALHIARDLAVESVYANQKAYSADKDKAPFLLPLLDLLNYTRKAVRKAQPDEATPLSDQRGQALSTLQLFLNAHALVGGTSPLVAGGRNPATSAFPLAPFHPQEALVSAYALAHSFLLVPYFVDLCAATSSSPSDELLVEGTKTLPA